MTRMAWASQLVGFSRYGLLLCVSRGLDANLVKLACSPWPYDTPPLAPLHMEIPILLVTADFDGKYVI